MPKRFPLPLREPIGPNTDVEPLDVVITKRSLSRLGHFNENKNGLTPFPDKELFEGIRSFQAEQGLASDGLMKPDGPTARKMGRLLSPDAITDGVSSPSLQAATKTSSPSDEQCDHLFWNVDIPVCQAIQRRRGKRAAAICFHTAAARYAACLKGVPIDELPPLGTWNH